MNETAHGEPPATALTTLCAAPEVPSMRCDVESLADGGAAPVRDVVQIFLACARNDHADEGEL